MRYLRRPCRTGRAPGSWSSGIRGGAATPLHRDAAGGRPVGGPHHARPVAAAGRETHGCKPRHRNFRSLCPYTRRAGTQRSLRTPPLVWSRRCRRPRVNQGLGSRADDTGRAAPRAIPGAEEAEPPNLGCLQRLGRKPCSETRPQLISTTTSHYAPIGPTTPPLGNVAHMSSPELSLIHI